MPPHAASVAAQEYAERKRQQVEKARVAREERMKKELDRDCTFKPAKLAKDPAGRASSAECTTADGPSSAAPSSIRGGSRDSLGGASAASGRPPRRADDCLPSASARDCSRGGQRRPKPAPAAPPIPTGRRRSTSRTVGGDSLGPMVPVGRSQIDESSPSGGALRPDVRHHDTNKTVHHYSPGPRPRPSQESQSSVVDAVPASPPIKVGGNHDEDCPCASCATNRCFLDSLRGAPTRKAATASRRQWNVGTAAESPRRDAPSPAGRRRQPEPLPEMASGDTPAGRDRQRPRASPALTPARADGPSHPCSLCEVEVAVCAAVPCGHVCSCVGCRVRVQQSTRCPVCQCSTQMVMALQYGPFPGNTPPKRPPRHSQPARASQQASRADRTPDADGWAAEDAGDRDVKRGSPPERADEERRRRPAEVKSRPAPGNESSAPTPSSLSNGGRSPLSSAPSSIANGCGEDAPAVASKAKVVPTPVAGPCTRQAGCACKQCSAAMAVTAGVAAPAVVEVAVEAEGVIVTYPCQHCSRSFSEQALPKHETICKKVFQSKRRVFDSKQARQPEGEDVVFAPPKSRKGMSAAEKKAAAAAAAADALAAEKKKQWKQKSEAFRAAMRHNRVIAAHEAAGKPLSEMPVLQSAPDPSLVPCPHCGRRFRDEAAKRHIPICKKVFTNKPRS
mmetsp:Transcript_133679/g.303179  ORF Transcript_133679/g.303179 Transcript_133679/m.303179 type:complete len:677 (+) Transcript_133679:18-2048(+)